MMGNLRLAWMFLTRIPLPGVSGQEINLQNLGASSAWFPLIGGVLGLIVYGGWLLGVMTFAPAVNAVLAMILMAILTGGMHLDGLMDTVDGLMGAREKSRILEIMKDSRIGAMGALAAVLALLLKWSLLTSLLIDEAPGIAEVKALGALVLAPVLGRWGMVFALFVYPYARAEGGLGESFTRYTGIPQMLIASLTTLLLAGLIARWSGLIAFLGVFLVIGLLSHRINQMIGGMTGDICGALNEIGELTGLLFLAGMLK